MSKSTTEIYPLYIEARQWLQQRREEYQKMVNDCARQGYRPQYCIHGVNQWVDYDCACSSCELDDRSELEEARDLARQWLRKEKVRETITIINMEIELAQGRG